MTGTEHTTACVEFTETVLGWHHTLAWSPDDPVPMCSCGHPAMTCEINCAAREAHLLTPLMEVIRAGRGQAEPTGAGGDSVRGSGTGRPTSAGGRS